MEKMKSGQPPTPAEMKRLQDWATQLNSHLNTRVLQCSGRRSPVTTKKIFPNRKAALSSLVISPIGMDSIPPPKRTTPFCYIVFYDSQRHGVNSVSCDAENMSERIKKAIGFPKNRLNSQ